MVKLCRGEIIKFLFQQLLMLVAMLIHAQPICFMKFVESLLVLNATIGKYLNRLNFVGELHGDDAI
jgi:hypothetical protein